MIEALISVAVLGLVTVASLKLVALSNKSLTAVRDREAIIDEASRMRIMLEIDPLQFFGISGDIRWTIDEREEDLWITKRLEQDKNYSETPEGRAMIAALGREKLRWRELQLDNKGTVMTLFLPYSEEAAAALSEDKRDAKQGS